MGRDEVNIKVSSNVAEAIRLWEAMQKGPEAMAEALEDTGKKGKQAASGMDAEFGKLVGKWVSIGTAIGGAKVILDEMIKAQQQYNQMVKDASIPVDTLSRNFVNQAGYTNKQGEQAKGRILSIAEKRAVTPQTAFETATQLTSSGFAPNEASGGGLNEILKLTNSINATGKNVNTAEVGGAVLNFLQAMKMPATGESVAKLSPQIHGLFQTTDLKPEHLAAFSPKAAVIRGATGLGPEMMSMFTQFLALNSDAGSAGTAFATAAVGLRTASSEPAKVQALKSIGLKPEDVDSIGEDFYEVQRRFARALEAADPVTASNAAKRVLGREGLLAVDALFNPQAIEETERLRSRYSSPAEFDRAAAVTEGSIEGKARSAESRNAKEFADPSYLDPDTVRKNMLTALQQSGKSKYQQAWIMGGFDTSLNFVDAETALNLNYPMGTPEDRQAKKAIIEQSQSSMPGDIKVKVELTDQDAVAIPHKSEVSKLNQAK